MALPDAEYRTKPSNLNAFSENDFSDVFVAFVPCKRIALTAAYAHLGQIRTSATSRRYISRRS
jgi:hypothetical protein